MIFRQILLSVFLAFPGSVIFCQDLKPGFDPSEYLDVLALTFGKYDSLKKAQASPSQFALAYQSPVVGLDNRWSLWLRRDKGLGVISIRGTVSSGASWLANVYAVMQPGSGSFTVDSLPFRYRVAADTAAAVHTGWLIAMAALSGTVEQQIRAAYQQGTRQFIVTGHSQGAGIAYLLRSYLHYRTLEGALPADIVYKTYCSAAPKPGNLYYAYDFEFINRGGWAFTIVNAADWVPETPTTVQNFSDLNDLNPFRNANSMLRNQKLAIRAYANLVYRRLNGSAENAVRKQQRYLGKKVGKEVNKKLPLLDGLQKTNTQNYMRAGSPVVLMPDEAYFQKFTNDPLKNRAVWTHHGFDAYVWLLRKDYGKDR